MCVLMLEKEEESQNIFWEVTQEVLNTTMIQHL